MGDIGNLTIDSLRGIAERTAFFRTRLRQGIRFLDTDGGRIDLLALLGVALAGGDIFQSMEKPSAPASSGSTAHRGRSVPNRHLQCTHGRHHCGSVACRRCSHPARASHRQSTTSRQFAQDRAVDRLRVAATPHAAVAACPRSTSSSIALPLLLRRQKETLRPWRKTPGGYGKFLRLTPVRRAGRQVSAGRRVVHRANFRTISRKPARCSCGSSVRAGVAIASTVDQGRSATSGM